MMFTTCTVEQLLEQMRNGYRLFRRKDGCDIGFGMVQPGDDESSNNIQHVTNEAAEAMLKDGLVEIDGCTTRDGTFELKLTDKGTEAAQNAIRITWTPLKYGGQPYLEGDEVLVVDGKDWADDVCTRNYYPKERPLTEEETVACEHYVFPFHRRDIVAARDMVAMLAESHPDVARMISVLANRAESLEDTVEDAGSVLCGLEESSGEIHDSWRERGRLVRKQCRAQIGEPIADDGGYIPRRLWW